MIVKLAVWYYCLLMKRVAYVEVLLAVINFQRPYSTSSQCRTVCYTFDEIEAVAYSVVVV